MNGRDIRICTIFAFAKMEFMEKLHPIMFAGTGSDVGKSIIAAAFCRIFKQDGYQPAPFKAQNMALNSFATPEGLEIGRAQAVQAEAAGVPCHTDMNPLLLKPQSDHTSQVVLNGRPIGNRNAYDYFRKEGRDELRWEVCAAYDRLAARYNPVVLEGAGSISEINLRDTDLVNLPMALHAGADVILVGDIDRGGVFASVYGSLMLLRPHERERIKGILINKFRGDIRLFESGITMLEELCGIPVVGVVPYYRDIYIEEEDSVALAAKSVRAEKGKVNIAVILLRHLSNFTDFNVLERDPRVHLFYTNNVDELAKADVILLPGSKSTLDDLYELRRNGVAAAIIRAHREGATVMGICGGYQMMGELLQDPKGVEAGGELKGMGLLPIQTVFAGEKMRTRVQGTFEGLSGSLSSLSQVPLEGYEIHMGVTTYTEEPCPLVQIQEETGERRIRYDGARKNNCYGCYVHGIFDQACVASGFVSALLKEKGYDAGQLERLDWKAYKETQYNKLAEIIRESLDMEYIYQILGKGTRMP